MDGASRGLLSCANLRGSGAARSAPFVSDKVAWPSLEPAPVDTLSLAQSQDKVWLGNWRSQMLRNRHSAEALAQAACPRGPCCDPALTRDAGARG
eukprot:1177449-Pyramimonas_sp.AAC.1